MAARWAVVAVALVGSGPAVCADSATTPLPELGRLREHVATLASPEFGGRRGAGARKAEAYIVEHLRAVGLEPLFDGKYTQDILQADTGAVIGRNVGALLRGSDPELAEQHVILSAHYDHLGVRNGVLYPGADDNASGVAMLLEAARCLAESAERPRRSVQFVAFDLEEDGLFGSRYFVAQPPVPLERIALFLTADLIAGSLGGICKDQVFVLGAERAPEVRPWLDEAAQGLNLDVAANGANLDVAPVGTDLLVIDRSDYGPFRQRKVPYLFFSTGESPRYHTRHDTPESLDYPKLEAISRLILGVVARAAAADERPAWRESPEHSVTEAAAVRRVLLIFLDQREQLQIPRVQETLMRSTLTLIEGILERGTMTPSERTRVVRVAQLVLFSIL